MCCRARPCAQLLRRLRPRQQIQRTRRPAEDERRGAWEPGIRSKLQNEPCSRMLQPVVQVKMHTLSHRFAMHYLFSSAASRTVYVSQQTPGSDSIRRHFSGDSSSRHSCQLRLRSFLP